jgi:hypothetical protein
MEHFHEVVGNPQNIQGESIFCSRRGPARGTNHAARHLFDEAATRCFTQRLSRIAKGRKARRSQRRLSRVAMVAASFIDRQTRRMLLRRHRQASMM